MYVSMTSFPLRSRIVGALAVLFTLAGGAAGETWVAVTADAQAGVGPAVAPQAPELVVNWYNDSGLELTVDVAGLLLAPYGTTRGEFTIVSCPETPLGGAVGEPALPVVRRLFVVPDGAAVRLTVDEGPSTAIDLHGLGLTGPVRPLQPPRTDEPEGRPAAALAYDPAAYAAAGFRPDQRATVTELGRVRGQRLYWLEVRPVAYQATRGQLLVWPHINVQIAFEGGGGPGGPGPLSALRGALLNPPPRQLLGRGSGNYLILVVDTNLANALSGFVAAKTAEGFTVSTHTFAPGTTKQTIKAYIQNLWGGPSAPDYILLVGDSDTFPAWTGGGVSTSSTDLPYACMDAGDDWYPDIAIGRFSLRTVTDLQAAIDKTLYVAGGAYSDPDYVRRATFIATNDVESAAEETQDWVISTYMDPNGMQSTRLYVRLGADTDDVSNAFNAGCVFGMYYGHSWSNYWRDPEFDHSHVQALTNADMYAFVLHFTCNMGRYADEFTDPCFAERWLRVANKGAAATVAASRLIYYLDNPGWPETSNLEKFFFDSVYLDGTPEIGPAWQGDLYRLLALYGPEYQVTRDYFEMFNLLGDPALAIPSPAGFTVSADPPTQDVCSPPATQAQYSINVQPTGDFNSAVTLSAGGGPAGSTVVFSANSLVPPFTSVMTLGNIQGGSPGQYTIAVTGTAGTMQRFTSVGLRLSSGLPGTVTLSSPANGAVDTSRTPTLVWQPASGAAQYLVQLAKNQTFTPVEYSATLTGTSHTVGTPLDTATEYFWRVCAENGCGPGNWSSIFHFTTIYQPNYFTEEFTSGDFDLAYRTVTFIPDQSADRYHMCGGTATALPTDPTGGSTISLAEDGSKRVNLGQSQTVQLYNMGYSYFFAGSNGYITWINGDSQSEPSLPNHFNLPRVAALFDDLSPPSGGLVSWKQLEDRAAVTYQNVPEYGTSNLNTFQIEMFFDGQIRITWLAIASTSSLVGLSEGLGVPADFVETDLSDTDACLHPGDMNCDGSVNNFDITPFVKALTDPDVYHQQYPNCDINNGDINGDGVVNNFDITPFVHLLVGD